MYLYIICVSGDVISGSWETKMRMSYKTVIEIDPLWLNQIYRRITSYQMITLLAVIHIFHSEMVLCWLDPDIGVLAQGHYCII